jgi:hypothetical protein
MPSRRRRFLVLAILGAAVAMPVVVWLLWPRPSAITRENAERIQLDMTLTEVEAILGGPPRDETGGWRIPSRQHVARRPDAEWIGPQCAVCVNLHEGRVTLAYPLDVIEPDENPLDRLRRWFGL